MLELAGLAKQGEIDHIVVESTGISEPLPVAATFSAAIAADVGGAAEGLQSLNDVARLHSLVTVVDCSTFLTHLVTTPNPTPAPPNAPVATTHVAREPLALLLLTALSATAVC